MMDIKFSNTGFDGSEFFNHDKNSGFYKVETPDNIEDIVYVGTSMNGYVFDSIGDTFHHDCMFGRKLEDRDSLKDYKFYPVKGISFTNED